MYHKKIANKKTQTKTNTSKFYNTESYNTVIETDTCIHPHEFHD